MRAAPILTMNRVDEYLKAAERKNTLLSYASALRHFEEEWKGLLPASSDAIARYLADYAPTLSVGTLRHRLAALSRWHSDQGFADPTKTPTIRQLLKGIRSVHNAPEKKARPLELVVLEQVDAWLTRNIAQAWRDADQAAELRYTRDRSLILLGFWRGFRSDELVRLSIKNVQVVASEGMTCYLDRSKGDRQALGRIYKCPSLSRLCPVTAFSHWINLSKLDQGPVYRSIDRWGNISEQAMHPNSLIPLLRNMLSLAGVVAVDEYSSHSLRRGFAGWAHSSGWDIKELMEYVGWTDIKSAMRYLEGDNASLQARFERGLGVLTEQVDSTLPTLPPTTFTAQPPIAPRMATVLVTMSLERYNKESRGLTRGRRLIEEVCFGRYAMQRQDALGTRYELTIPYPDDDALDETIYALLDEMYRIADDNQCLLEVSLHEPASGKYWD